VIVLPCRVARPFLALPRRTSVARPRDAPPFACLRRGPGGRSPAARRGGVGLRRHRPGALEPVSHSRPPPTTSPPSPAPRT